MAKQAVFFSIGHSNHTLEKFLDLLRVHGVSAVADVRSTPRSRYCPQFNKTALSKSLGEHGIKYVYLGRELGGRPGDPACYGEDGKVVYRAVAKTSRFIAGIRHLKKGASDHRVAIMCAEREPLECHRTLLVSKALGDERLDVRHIHSDGHLEPHADAMERLLDLVGLPSQDLFRSRRELLAEARAIQERRIAYQAKDLSGGLRVTHLV